MKNADAFTTQQERAVVILRDTAEFVGIGAKLELGSRQVLDCSPLESMLSPPAISLVVSCPSKRVCISLGGEPDAETVSSYKYRLDNKIRTTLPPPLLLLYRRGPWATFSLPMGSCPLRRERETRIPVRLPLHRSNASSYSYSLSPLIRESSTSQNQGGTFLKICLSVRNCAFGWHMP